MVFEKVVHHSDCSAIQVQWARLFKLHYRVLFNSYWGIEFHGNKINRSVKHRSSASNAKGENTFYYIISAICLKIKIIILDIISTKILCEINLFHPVIEKFKQMLSFCQGKL